MYKGLSAVIFAIAIFVILTKIVNLVKKKMFGQSIVTVCLLILIPVACNACLVLAPGNDMNILTSGAMAFALPLFIWISENEFTSQLKKVGFKIILLLVLWTNIIIVINDQAVLKDGRTSTYTVAEQILSTVQGEGFDITKDKLAIVGRASEYPFFVKRGNWYWADEYAQFGKFFTTTQCINMSWSGVYRNLFGIEISMPEYTQVDEIIRTEDFAKMNTFPQENSVKQINNVWVIKMEN